MPTCQMCGRGVFDTIEAVCRECGGVFCADHIEAGNHGCGDSEESDEQDLQGEEPSTEDAREQEASTSEPETTQESPSVEDSEPPTEVVGNPQGVTVESDSSSGSGGRFIAGAIVLAAGGLMSITGVGAIFGVPMMFFGFAIMFPRFATAMVLLAVLAFLFLLMSL